MSAQITFKLGNEKDIQTYLCATFKKFIDSLGFDEITTNWEINNLRHIKTYVKKFMIDQSDFDPLHDENRDNLNEIICAWKGVFLSLHTIALHEKLEGCSNSSYPTRFIWRQAPRVSFEETDEGIFLKIIMRCGATKFAPNVEASNES